MDDTAIICDEVIDVDAKLEERRWRNKNYSKKF